MKEEEDLGGDCEHIVLVEVVQQVLIKIVVKKKKVVLKIMIMAMMATVIISTLKFLVLYESTFSSLS